MDKNHRQQNGNHNHHQLDDDRRPPCARLCHIRKWDDFDGYGFNLHAEKGKSGQFIGKVDEGSPSEAAGLRQGDRIVEVNEINIAGETHKQVVERIKAFPTETKLLVVDQRADDYYRRQNAPIKGTMPGVLVIRTPERSAREEEEQEEEKVGHRRSSSSSSTGGKSGAKRTEEAEARSERESAAGRTTSNGEGAEDTDDDPTTTTKQLQHQKKATSSSDARSIASSCDGGNGSISNQDATSINGNYGSRLDDDSASTKSTSSAGTSINGRRSNGYDDGHHIGNGAGGGGKEQEQQQQRNANGNGTAEEEDAASGNATGSDSSSASSSAAAAAAATTTAAAPSLDLAMSAKELRAKLAQRKKYDPKKESLGFKDKFDIVQKL